VEVAVTAPAYDPIDLSSRAFWSTTDRDRDVSFATLRAERPLSFHRPVDDAVFPDPTDPGFWAAVRHADIVEASRRSEVFVSGQGVLFESVPPEMLEATQSFLAMDDPRHAQIRGIVRAAFTPRQVQRAEDQVRATAHEIVAALPESGEFDVVTDLAAILPMRTICDMIGIPAEQHQTIADAVALQTGFGDPDIAQGRSAVECLGTAIMTEHAIAAELVAQRRAHPSDDLMSALVAAEVDDQRLTDAEIAAFFVLLCVAGNDTSRQTIAHGVKALADHPEQRAWLAANTEARMGGALEEMLRWATPVMTFRRTVVVDTELGGQPLSAGEKVVLFYSSGNRDGSVFPDPWTFDLRRTENNHVAFGGGGPHYCLGHFLARTQIRAMFRELLGRFPDFAADQPAYLSGNFIHGVKSMAVHV
jgi:cytochrome P450